MELRVVGRVVSPLDDIAAAPKQGREGAPDAVIAFVPEVADALADVRVGDELLVLTWLHLGDRSTLRVHPRDDPGRPLTGVFSTRSADRPNPIGLHPVRVVAVDGLRVTVAGLEAVDGTPVVDVKVALDGPPPAPLAPPPHAPPPHAPPPHAQTYVTDVRGPTDSKGT